MVFCGRIGAEALARGPGLGEEQAGDATSLSELMTKAQR